MPPRAKAAAAGGGGAQGSGSAPVVTNEAALAQQNAWHAAAKADVLKTVGYGFDVNVVRRAQKVKTYEYVASLKEYDHAVKTGVSAYKPVAAPPGGGGNSLNKGKRSEPAAAVGENVSNGGQVGGGGVGIPASASTSVARSGAAASFSTAAASCAPASYTTNFGAAPRATAAPPFVGSAATPSFGAGGPQTTSFGMPPQQHQHNFSAPPRGVLPAFQPSANSANPTTSSFEAAPSSSSAFGAAPAPAAPTMTTINTSARNLTLLQQANAGPAGARPNAGTTAGGIRRGFGTTPFQQLIQAGQQGGATSSSSSVAPPASSSGGQFGSSGTGFGFGGPPTGGASASTGSVAGGQQFGQTQCIAQNQSGQTFLQFGAASSRHSQFGGAPPAFSSNVAPAGFGASAAASAAAARSFSAGAFGAVPLQFKSGCGGPTSQFQQNSTTLTFNSNSAFVPPRGSPFGGAATSATRGQFPAAPGGLQPGAPSFAANPPARGSNPTSLLERLRAQRPAVIDLEDVNPSGVGGGSSAVETGCGKNETNTDAKRRRQSADGDVIDLT